MNIVHVIPALDKVLGGPPRVAVGLSRGLAHLGETVRIITTSARGWSESELNDPLLGVNVVLSRGRLFQVALRAFTGADVVHFHCIWDPLSALLAEACVRSGVPYVCMPHGALGPRALARKRLKKWLYLQAVVRRMLQKAGGVHVCNHEEADEIRLLRLDVALYILPNGTFPEEVDMPCTKGLFRQTFGISDDSPIVAFMSRLEWKKGVDILVEGFAQVAKEFLDAKLVIAGPDHGFQSTICRAIAVASLGDRVTITGMLDGTLRNALLQDADIFALPSRQEGHPIAVIEAAATGRALLITRSCHCSELEQANAALVVSGSVAGVTEGLRLLLQSRALREDLGQKARKVAERQYHWHGIAAELRSHYGAIVNRRVPAPLPGPPVPDSSASVASRDAYR